MVTRRPITLVSERSVALPTLGDKVLRLGEGLPVGDAVALLEWHSFFGGGVASSLSCIS